MRIWPFNPLLRKMKKAVRDAGLKRIFPILKQFTLPAVMFELEKVDSPNLLSGLSHVGGTPDLPVDFTWPECKGRRLDFIAQINLAEVAPHDKTGLIPPTGMLSFFYDLEEMPSEDDLENSEAFHVAYFDAATPLVLYPNEIDNEDPIPACAAKFFPCLTIPHPWTDDFEDLDDLVELSDEENDLYEDMILGWSEIFSPSHASSKHRLLGHSFNVQSEEMKYSAEIDKYRIKYSKSGELSPEEIEKIQISSRDWVLLFQLDSDDEAEIMWGHDDGILYYWIRQQDLRELRFDQVWMTMQEY